jgi:hypothetical protein
MSARVEAVSPAVLRNFVNRGYVAAASGQVSEFYTRVKHVMSNLEG